ncbi:unnamed protein product, partial [Ectocarpus sp. 8 AP-2014]
HRHGGESSSWHLRHDLRRRLHETTTLLGHHLGVSLRPPRPRHHRRAQQLCGGLGALTKEPSRSDRIGPSLRQSLDGSAPLGEKIRNLASQSPVG